MKTILLDRKNVTIYNVDDFPYSNFTNIDTVSHKNKNYVNLVTAFDIETTTMLKEECNIFGRDFGFMYVWQFAVEHTVCMGRTWQEFTIFLEKLCDSVNTRGRKLVIWVHNLSFEFQFMRNFIQFVDVFARKARKIMRAETKNIEFRCSYFLTNMALEKFTQKTPGIKFVKKSGEEFNYSIKRYPDTELSDKELGYCCCDVLGLVEGIHIKLDLYKDTLATVPMTSTGYVRRAYREKCLPDRKHMSMFTKSALNEEVYTITKEAARGAISGSSHLFTDETIEEVDSQDIKSSYPFQMLTKYFPKGKFVKCNNPSNKLLREILDNYCVVITWKCDKIKLKRYSGIPYISKGKCRAIEGGKTGNGKVYKADKICMTCTEIDLKIIDALYTSNKESIIDNLNVIEMWYCPRDMLSRSFREYLAEMFQTKTDLEDGDEFIYNKYKNEINASFGMMCTDITHDEYVYDCYKKVWLPPVKADPVSALLKYYNGKYNFLSYQDGVWVMAHGRDSLNEGMVAVGGDLVQVDTDSVKHVENHRRDFKEINDRIIINAENFDIKPYAIKNGSKHYLGIWEHEDKGRGANKPTYKYFRTLGAKKYAYDNGDGKGVHITVAGLRKDTAAKWITEHGGLKIFTNGTVVPAMEDGNYVSGRTASTYNDLTRPILISIDGHMVQIGSNIGVRNVEYTFGMTSEWLDLVARGVVKNDAQLPINGAYKNLMVRSQIEFD